MQFNQTKSYLADNQFTWLITGVAGFIGSNLLETLLTLNQKVIGLDNFSTGYKHNIDEVLQKLPAKTVSNFVFHEGDVCSLCDCEAAMLDVDYVLHQAALGSVPRSIKDPLASHANNVAGFLNMLNTAKDHQIKRFVYASSSSVYGDSPVLPKVENQIGNPLSPYAVSKFTDELYAKVFSLCYGIETIGLRYFNVFGARQDPSGAYAAVIPLWIKAILNGEPICINGDGETTRDFCYIKNVVQANLLAATTTKPEAINTVYNIAVGEQTSLNKLVEMVASMTNLTGKHKVYYKEFRAGDIRHSLADIGKARDKLGYEPTHKIHDGLQESMDWYVKFFGV